MSGLNKFALRLSAVLALALPLLIPGAQAGPVQLDWDDPGISWPPGSLGEALAVGSGNVGITFSGDTAAFSAGSPSIAPNPTGGLLPAQNVLNLSLDFGAGSGNVVPITIDFTHAGGVSDVSFGLFDVDRNGSAVWDEVEVTATDGNATFDPSSITIGNPNPLIGNQIVPPNVVSGTSNVPNNSGNANATFTFDQSGITRITILFRYPGSDPDPGFMLIGLHDIDFTEIGGGGNGNGEPGPTDIRLEKRADRARVSVGDFVRYSVVVENLLSSDVTGITLIDEIPAGFSYVAGSASLDDGSSTLTVDGERPVSFGGIDVAGGADVTLSYVLRVGAGVVPGASVNRVAASVPGGLTSNASSASVSVTADPDFGEAAVIGKVFHDRNGDGRQQPGEEGVPGVRLATVSGLLVETDAHGRYHLAGLDGGQPERGRNFIIKVDPATLPRGAEFTTENPRVKRITHGTSSRIDFGIRLPDQQSACCRIVEVRLGEIHFSATSDVLRPEFMPVLGDLAERLREHGGGVLTIEGLDDARVRRVQSKLAELLGDDLIRRVEVVRTGREERRRSDLSQPEICDADLCREEKGYALEVIHGAGARPGTGEDRPVAVGGQFVVALPQGGRLWSSEDPAAVDPRLAAAGPEILPVENGRITEAAKFQVYTNYAAFIDRAEIVFYGPGDMDRVKPVARLPVPVRPFGEVEWNGAADSTFAPGAALSWVLRAYDAAGHLDETAVRSIRLVARRAYAARPHESLPRLESVRSVADAETDGTQPSTPLAGNLLVLRPPAPLRETVTERKQYTLRPLFGDLQQRLSDGDKAEIDGLTREWRDLTDLRLQVTGHTDSGFLAGDLRDRFADKYELSEARARAVATYLRRVLSLPAEYVVATGKGPDEPVASNVTAGGRALNNRIQIRIIGVEVTFTEDGPVDLQLVDPVTGSRTAVTHGLTAAENMLRRKPSRDLSRSAEPAAAAGTALTRSADALDAVFGRSDLRRQTIPIRGSRVRVHGQDLRGDYDLIIDGEAMPVDAQGRLAVEYLLPVGRHEFRVAFTSRSGERLTRRLPVEVTGRHLFYVALADATVSGSDLTGSVEPLSGDERFAEDSLVEGRLALYLKGKIKGKYLITAQLDSEEEQLEDLLGNLDEKDPESVFRRLDPDRYYPVYGDDSTTRSDTDTQGRMYVRVDWDRSQALWGNYQTGITGNEFAWYNRSLYGAKLHYESLETTSRGEAKSRASVFGSETQTALGHSELLGTGGSLYYLRHRDILPGSEKARVEIRDRDSGRVVENVGLMRGADYEIDELQGRIILSRPLAQVSRQFVPSLIKDDPLDGNDVVLLVDYEYVPEGFNPDEVTAGARGKQWIGDHVALGGTYVQESRDGEDYRLHGADLTLAAGRGTYLKLEYAETEASQAPRFFSDNGGLSFTTLNPSDLAERNGDALAVEGRANFKELTGGEREWIASAWWRTTDEGFSVARRDAGVEATEYGAELVGEVGSRVRLSARASFADLEATREDQRYSVQSDIRTTKRGTLSAEVRQVRERPAADPDFTEGMLGAVRYAHRVTSLVDVYATGQYTIDDDGGLYAPNDLGTLGARVKMGDRTHLQLEASSGDRGEGGTLMIDHQANSRHRLYGSYTHSTDRTDAPGARSGLALGQRSRLSNQTTVYAESQFARSGEHAGLAHVFGLDFAPRPGWTLGASAQTGELELEGGAGIVDRDAAGLSAGYTGRAARWFTRVEYRSDAGAEEREQLLTSNRLDLKFSPSTRLLAKLNLSDTEDDVDSSRDARFVEASLGLAYRPVRHDRLNLLGKYTFLYDLPSVGQAGAGPDQRSDIFSLEAIYGMTRRWELGIKLAQRQGELRTDRSEGDWFESGTGFASIRSNFHLIRKWDALVEYRRLDVDEAGTTRKGFLAGLDRHFGEHFKLGAGYNFTDFTDDLTELDYEHKGWFLNFVTKY